MHSNMHSIQFMQATSALNALDAALDGIDRLELDLLSTAEALELLSRLETAGRRLPSCRHALINHLAAYATRKELGGKLSHALADRLRISRKDAARRIHETADLGPRRALTGEALEPRLPATAEQQRRGLIGASTCGSSASSSTTCPTW
jgi:hypothetical protein